MKQEPTAKSTRPAPLATTSLQAASDFSRAKGADGQPPATQQARASLLYWPKTLAGAPRYIFDGAAEALRPIFLPDFTRQPADPIHKILKFLVIGRIPVGPRLAAWLTGFEGWKELRHVRPTDRFIADGVTNPRTLQAIAWILPEAVRKYNYFNNSLRFALPGKDIGALMDRMRHMGYHLITFDPDDAASYHLQLTEQFYRDPAVLPQPGASTMSEASPSAIPTHAEAFFCGENKGRRADLSRLQQTLEAAGLTCRFIIVDKPSQYISYDEYLRHLSACQCLIDWVQADQAGITRRPIEALFWQKKLITNHKALLQADFYHPDNIFIVGHDDAARLPHFLQQPLAPIPASVKQRYDVNHWLGYLR